ncbi:MAG: type II 3-dehydroquinate dehydratase [Casimicrobiaceae bacterium]
MATKTSPRKRAPTAVLKRQPGGSRILVLHGPNLNLLGTREPKIYGYDTLSDVNARLVAQARAAGVTLAAYQSNYEGALIERIHQARLDGVAYIMINPAGLTHTSVPLRDALSGTAIPFVEVHLSNIHSREPFRAHSYFSDKAIGTVAGLGAHGYELALQYILRRLDQGS